MVIQPPWRVYKANTSSVSLSSDANPSLWRSLRNSLWWPSFIINSANFKKIIFKQRWKLVFNNMKPEFLTSWKARDYNNLLWKGISTALSKLLVIFQLSIFLFPWFSEKGEIPAKELAHAPNNWTSSTVQKTQRNEQITSDAIPLTVVLTYAVLFIHIERSVFSSPYLLCKGKYNVGKHCKNGNKTTVLKTYSLEVVH